MRFMEFMLTDYQAQGTQHLAPKVYTYKKKTASATKALTMREDQFGNVSRIRTQTIRPSELTGWVVTHTDPPITDTETASAAKGLPADTTQPAGKTSATPSPSSITIARQACSIVRSEALDNASARPIIFSNVTLTTKTYLAEASETVGNTMGKPSDIEGDFEVVSKAELDDDDLGVMDDGSFEVVDDEDFGVVDGEGPSAVNG